MGVGGLGLGVWGIKYPGNEPDCFSSREGTVTSLEMMMMMMMMMIMKMMMMMVVVVVVVIMMGTQ